jgi:hypothetical protein
MSCSPALREAILALSVELDYTSGFMRTMPELAESEVFMAGDDDCEDEIEAKKKQNKRNKPALKESLE